MPVTASQREENPTRDRALLSLLFELNQEITRGKPLNLLLQRIVTATCDLSAADSASVMLLDETGHRLICQASHGLSRQEQDLSEFRLGEGVAGWVAAQSKALRIADTRQESRFKTVSWQQHEQRSLCCVPMRGRSGVLGVIAAGAAEPNRFGEADEELFNHLAAAIAKDVENARLFHLAVTDPLTGAYNRQHFSSNFPTEFERARRYDHPLSLAMVDIDNFKEINDRFGHPVGDGVLREVSHRLRRLTRDFDSLVRYGGDEFVLMLPATALEGAAPLTERLRADMSRQPLEIGHARVPVTVSGGLAEISPTDKDAGDLLQRADRALYRAKREGRNRVLCDAG
ncbi:MAG: sensor domain-containing diguanylate cyclase [Deltaproteobacteria bacterium]|nr:sensor domain-containing diguanylate cyclase [Deltaproteobacteria bacterium]